MLNENYVVGLVDGEGSFTAYVKSLSQNRERIRRVRVEPKFCLKLIEEDKAILDELKKFFNCGNVYYQKDSRPNHKNCYRFEVTSRQDLSGKIIPFFKKNILQLKSKRRDFEIFCRIMDSVMRNEHLTGRGLLEISKLKQKMH